MTITGSNTRWDYTGNGVTTAFAYNNKIFATSDLKVYLDGTLKTLTTHYTVSGAGVVTGGNVTFLVAPALDVEILIVREVPDTQATDLPALGPFFVERVEDALDKRTVVSQQNSARIGRTLRQPTTDVDDMDELAAAADRAGKLAAWDDDGNPSLVDPTGIVDTDLGGLAGKFIKVNSTEDGYEFRTVAEVLSDLAVYTSAQVDTLFTNLRNGVSASFDTLAEIATDLGLKMVKSANLSDVADVATARTNLSVPKIGGLFGFWPLLGAETAAPTYVPLVGANMVISGSGHNDLYTVPVGKKAYIGTNFRLYNASAGSIDAYVEIKVSGTYYRLNLTTTVLTGAGATVSLTAPIILNAGESLSINCATTAGMNVRGGAFEFDAGETRYQTARILALANGNNVLLTCPVGKTILPAAAGANGGGSAGALAVCNASGSSRNYTAYEVPSGGSVGTTNQISPATAISDVTSNNFLVGPMTAGDFIVIDTNNGAAGQVAWLTYYQIP